MITEDTILKIITEKIDYTKKNLIFLIGIGYSVYSEYYINIINLLKKSGFAIITPRELNNFIKINTNFYQIGEYKYHKCISDIFNETFKKSNNIAFTLHSTRDYKFIGDRIDYENINTIAVCFYSSDKVLEKYINEKTYQYFYDFIQYEVNTEKSEYSEDIKNEYLMIISNNKTSIIYPKKGEHFNTIITIEDDNIDIEHDTTIYDGKIKEAVSC